MKEVEDKNFICLLKPSSESLLKTEVKIPMDQLTNLIQIQIAVDGQEPIYSYLEVEIESKLEEVCLALLESFGYFGKLIFNGLLVECDDTCMSKNIKMNDKLVLVACHIRIIPSRDIIFKCYWEGPI